jgi:hypothetical protein
MDLFEHLPGYKVLIRRNCIFAVPPNVLKSHLQRIHKGDHLDLCDHAGPATVARTLLSQPNMPLID